MTVLTNAAISAKLTPSEKSRFVKTTEELGLSPSAAIRIFVRRFNDCGGFPFAVVTHHPTVSIDASKVLRPQAGVSGRPILPSSWNDPEDDVYDGLS